MSLPAEDRAGGVVVNRRGEVLLIVNDIGKCTLPKGSLLPDESFEEAATREVLEEGGLRNVELVKELGTVVRPGLSSAKPDEPSVLFISY